MHAKQVLVLALALAYPTIASPVNNTFHRLTKRTNPQFLNFPPGSEDVTKLIHGTFDAFVLAAYAQGLRNNLPDVWNLYFPTSQQNAVGRVFQSIIPNVGDATNGGIGIAEFRFDSIDWLAGGETDLCARGAEGYTSNLADQTPTSITPFARVHICEKSLDDSDEEEPLFLNGLSCDAFFDEDDGKYHITEEMNVLGAIILHEMTHFNTLSVAAYDLSDPNIGDLTGMDPSMQVNYQESALVWDKTGQGAKLARELTVNQPNQSIKNAENYVWLAVESYWTFLCQRELSEAGQTRFVAPDA